MSDNTNKDEFMVEDDSHLDLSLKTGGEKSAAAPVAKEAPVAGESTSLPMFYHKPTPIEKDRHATAGLRKISNYRFASETIIIPANAGEFPLLAKHYPIVFSGQDLPLPVALVGLVNRNLFVSKLGEWAQYQYIPGYVRRYPFIFMEVPDHRMLLCIDEGADHFTQADAHHRLYDVEGAPTELTKNALKFSEDFQQDHNRTRAFAKLLQDEDLLTDRQVNFDLAGEPRRLAGFKVIDEEKIGKLSDEKLLAFAKNGVLPLIYHHLQSLSNLPTLAQMLRDQSAKKA